MPKPQTKDSYVQRLQRVDDHIHSHLDTDLSNDQLAEVACLSPYHWSRIYSAMRGETIAATLRRLRLQRAAERLAHSDLNLETIAERAGYTSTDAFGRAFREATGQSPVHYRQNGLHAAFRAAGQRNDTTGFPVSLETLPAQLCARIDHRGSYMQIDHAMGELFGVLTQRQLLPDNPAMIGLFFDDPDLGPETELKSRACMPVAAGLPIESPLIKTEIRGGLYARLHYTGPYAAMRDAYRWFLGTWLPASGHEPADSPIFEAYLNNPSEVPQSALRTNIHLPLRDQA